MKSTEKKNFVLDMSVNCFIQIYKVSRRVMNSDQFIIVIISILINEFIATMNRRDIARVDVIQN